MSRACVCGLALALVATSSPVAHGRGIRLFFSTVGLSNPDDTGSPASDPTGALGHNPVEFTGGPGSPVRLYVWAKLEPAGTPNNVTYHGVSFHVNATGTGAAVTDYEFWDYTAPGYSRWQQFTHSGTATSASFAGGGRQFGHRNRQQPVVMGE